MEYWKGLSEIIANFAQAMAVVVAALGVVSWLFKRSDRSADVLLQLETRFDGTVVRRARGLIDDDERYDEIKAELVQAVRDHRRSYAERPSGEPIAGTDRSTDSLQSIDELLRFYVLICGLHAARQVRTTALRACYRYWLTQYYNPKRGEFRRYVDCFYPTLQRWIRNDRSLFRRGRFRRFFTPRDFRWPDELES